MQYWADKDGTKLAKQATEWMTGIPMVYNADTLGIRPDLIGRKVDRVERTAQSRNSRARRPWSMLPSIGIMDVAMALESRGDLKYGNKGNMTKAEIDKTIEIMTGFKKSGHFRAFWDQFRPVGEPDGLGRGGASSRCGRRPSPR